LKQKNDFIAGMKNSFPIIMGYIPIGITYGILASQAGLNIITTVSMSLIVFAGSSQFICIDMINNGAATLAIIIMTFLVNLRHLLMSASLSLHFKKSNAKILPLLSFFITDESFAVGSAEINNYEHRDYFFLGLGITAYLGWVISSFIGVSLGNIIPAIDSIGLNFVLPAMFIVLLVLQIQNRLDIFISIISGMISIVFIYLLPGNWNVILATIIAASLGVVIERWNPGT